MDQALFLDTMIYLHFLSVEQINWHALLNVAATSHVVIVVPAVTLSEIDGHKANARLRERARRESQRIVAWLEAGSPEIRQAVWIAGRMDHPKIDFTALRLDVSWKDDVLIASAVEFQQEHAETRVTIVTDDGVLRLKAGSRGISVLTLPDELRVVPEEDEMMKENRALKRELLKLQAVTPVIGLKFAANAGKLLELIVRDAPEPSDELVSAELAELTRKYPPGESFQRKPRNLQPPHPNDPHGLHVDLLGMNIDAAVDFKKSLRGHLGAAEIARYDQERTVFMEKYNKHLRMQVEHERAKAREFELQINLVNTGSVPASDVDVCLTFPASVFIERMSLVGDAPKPPKPPLQPRGAAELAMRRAGTFGIQPFEMPHVQRLAHLFDPPRNVSSLTIEESNGFSVSCHVARVKHSFGEALPTIYLTVRDELRPQGVQATYKLYAANVPEPVEGVLNILFKSEP